ncbi:MAG: FAD-dependent oxidoreductase [Chloroflexi bacterium]|nr:MAG: FAD-dependent oxidoreductase [Chloroflexota bacterium]
MARTPLLRSLARLAADHAEAEATGRRPAEVRAERAEARERSLRAISRRDFLAGTAAAGAAVALGGSSAFAPSARAGGARVAIVGGGIAGLTCALTLLDKGVAATVYESSDRVGGRMHSDSRGYWSDGQTSEWCGELIDSGHKTILTLAQRYRLATVDLLGAEPNGSEDTYKFFGGYYPKDQADIDFQPVHQALQGDVQAASYPTLFNLNTPGGVALDHMSVYDWIESRVPGGHRSQLGVLLDVAYNIEYGAESTDQSSLNLVYLLGYKARPGNFAIFGASDERYHIVGGNERLPGAIAADVSARGSTIRTGWRMTSIARNADGTYSLAFDGVKAPVVADQVVLALPFAVLRTLDYRKAGFDSLKNTAIQDLGRGRNSKLHLQFTSRPWNGMGAWPGISNGSTYADTGYQNTWDVSRGQAGSSGIVVDYTGGDVAGSFRPSTPYSDASSLQVANYAAAFLRQIEPVLPGITARWNGKATLSVPMLDPNLNLSYTYWRVGQYTAFSGWEKQRMGNVHFAGEQCSQDFQGYMEGGASEGVRAAGEILDDLKFG